MHGNPADLLVGGLGLSGVQACPDRDAQLGDCRDDRVGGANRLGRLVKGREEPVSGRIDLSTAEPVELSADSSVVSRHKLLPWPVPESHGQVGRPHDVREKNCRYEPLWRPTGLRSLSDARAHCLLKFRSAWQQWQRLTFACMQSSVRRSAGRTKRRSA